MIFYELPARETFEFCNILCLLPQIIQEGEDELLRKSDNYKDKRQKVDKR